MGGGKRWGGDSNEVAEQLGSNVVSVAGNQSGAVFVALRTVDADGDDADDDKPASKRARTDSASGGMQIQKKPAATKPVMPQKKPAAKPAAPKMMPAAGDRIQKK